jgi:hypothetical protein
MVPSPMDSSSKRGSGTEHIRSSVQAGSSGVPVADGVGLGVIVAVHSNDTVGDNVSEGTTGDAGGVTSLFPFGVGLQAVSNRNMVRMKTSRYNGILLPVCLSIISYVLVITYTRTSRKFHRF